MESVLGDLVKLRGQKPLQLCKDVYSASWGMSSGKAFFRRRHDGGSEAPGNTSNEGNEASIPRDKP